MTPEQSMTLYNMARAYGYSEYLSGASGGDEVAGEADRNWQALRDYIRSIDEADATMPPDAWPIHPREITRSGDPDDLLEAIPGTSPTAFRANVASWHGKDAKAFVSRDAGTSCQLATAYAMDVLSGGGAILNIGKHEVFDDPMNLDGTHRNQQWWTVVTVVAEMP